MTERKVGGGTASAMDVSEELEALKSIFDQEVQWRKKEDSTAEESGYSVEVSMKGQVILTLELEG